ALSYSRHYSPHPAFITPFLFNDTATTEIYTLSLHDALPILRQTALETAADTRDARRVERHALLFGHPHRDRGKFGQEGGTAQRATTDAIPPQLFGLITGTDLAHLNADLQHASEVPDQATEIDPVCGGEIKDGLLTIKSKIHT